MGAPALQFNPALIPEGMALAWAPQPGPQTALVTCPVFDVMYGGARGGGKTDGLLGDFLGHALTYPQHARGLFVRRTYDELDEAIGRSHEIFGPLDWTWRPSRYTWLTPWGSFLKMRYLKRDEDAGRYQGHSYTHLSVDEQGNFPKPEPIDKLTATLRSKHGVPVRKRASSNPGGPGHGWNYARYVKPSAPFVPFVDPLTGMLRVFIPSKLEDNQILTRNDPTYRDRLRASGPAWLVRAWLEGDWLAAPEGGLIKGAWLERRYANLPADVYAFVLSIDTGFKENESNDPSVCTVWALGRNFYYLVDVWRERCAYPTLKSRVKGLCEKWHPTAVLIEDKASGQSLIQELRNDTAWPVLAIEPEGDKYARLLAASVALEAGKVLLPEAAPWVLDYQIELTCFPTKGMHDDQVDSTSQFLLWAAKHAAPGFQIATSGEKRVGYSADGF